MDRAEIERYLAAALGHSIMIDVRELPEFPGLVRTVLVHEDFHVTIEFPTARGYVDFDDEPTCSPKYLSAYRNLDDLIADLEPFLGVPSLSGRTSPGCPTSRCSSTTLGGRRASSTWRRSYAHGASISPAGRAWSSPRTTGGSSTGTATIRPSEKAKMTARSAFSPCSCRGRGHPAIATRVGDGSPRRGAVVSRIM
jgi:hypothetical protein